MNERNTTRRRKSAFAATSASSFALLALLSASPALAQIAFEMPMGQHLPTYGRLGTPLAANGFASGDLDGDGDVDILLAPDESRGEVVFLNDGLGRFRAAPFQPNLISLAPARRVALADVDGDGDLDALFVAGGSANYNPGQHSLLLNDGTGAFTLSRTLPPVNGAQLGGLVLEDLDGDGDPDALLTGAPTQFAVHFVEYWENDGSGVFTDVTSTVMPGETGGQSASFVDMTGDGRGDIVIGSQPSTRVWAADATGALPHSRAPSPLRPIWSRTSTATASGTSRAAGTSGSTTATAPRTRGAARCRCARRGRLLSIWMATGASKWSAEAQPPSAPFA